MLIRFGTSSLNFEVALSEIVRFLTGERQSRQSANHLWTPRKTQAAF